MNCAICLERIADPVQLSCPHKFHHSCLASWLTEHDNCPLCRKDIGIRQYVEPEEKPVISILINRGYSLNTTDSYRVDEFTQDIIYYDFANPENMQWEISNSNTSIKDAILKSGTKKRKKEIYIHFQKQIHKDKIIYFTVIQHVREWNYSKNHLKTIRNPKTYFRK